MPIDGLYIDNMTVTMAPSPQTPQEPAMTYERKKMAGEGMIIEYADHVVLTNVTVRSEKEEHFSVQNCNDVIIR